MTLISKLQCSGHRPICNRCTNRGLNCEYSVRELRTTTIRPIPLRKNLTGLTEITEIPAPQPAKYSGVCRSAQNICGSVRAGGALRMPSSSYGIPPPPYTPRQGLSTYKGVRWVPSQQSPALSAQNGSSHMATRDRLPAPIKARRRSAVSNSSCRPAYSIPYQLPPHQYNPVIRIHEEGLTYMRDGIVSMPMPESSHLPFDLEMPR